MQLPNFNELHEQHDFYVSLRLHV